MFLRIVAPGLKLNEQTRKGKDIISNLLAESKDFCANATTWTTDVLYHEQTAAGQH